MCNVTGNLLYVKEDLIIPNQYTFYDLIINKARGKSGPLFHFDVHEDVRLQSDARIEKDESHAGKVVERHWYSRSAHGYNQQCLCASLEALAQCMSSVEAQPTANISTLYVLG